MKNLAIIPARGGSKRIPRKNIKNFLGKPIIAYSIEIAIKSGLFDEIMVSTDDKEIAEIAKKYGAKIPFFRSKDTANDTAPLNDVVQEVVQEYQKRGEIFDYICLILPTAPLITKRNLINGYELLKNSNFDSVRPIVRFSFPIQRAFRLTDKNEVVPMNPDDFKKRSQDLEPAFHDSGQFYWIKGNKDLSKNKGAFEISELEAQDIDNETDWKLAELKYKLLLKEYSCKFELAAEKNYDDYFEIRSEKKNMFWTGYDSPPNYKNFFEWYKKRIIDETKFLYLIYIDDNCVGSLNIDYYDDYVLIGYSVKEAYEGKGLGTCIVKNSLEIIKKNSFINTVRAWVNETNKASVRVLQKNNFYITDVSEYRNRFGKKEKYILLEYNAKS